MDVKQKMYTLWVWWYNVFTMVLRIIRRPNERKQAMSDLKTKLAEASEKVEKQRKERRTRAVKGSHLVEAIKAKCDAAGLTFRENSGFYVFSGPAGKNVRIAIARRGGVVDFLSFTVDSPAVTPITPEVAAAKHLGRVQGRIAFDGTDEETLAAIDEAIKVLLTPAVEPVKVPRAPRTPKVKVPVATAEVPAVAQP